MSSSTQFPSLAKQIGHKSINTRSSGRPSSINQATQAAGKWRKWRRRFKQVETSISQCPRQAQHFWPTLLQHVNKLVSRSKRPTPRTSRGPHHAPKFSKFSKFQNVPSVSSPTQLGPICNKRPNSTFNVHRLTSESRGTQTSKKSDGRRPAYTSRDVGHFLLAALAFRLSCCFCGRPSSGFVQPNDL